MGVVGIFFEDEVAEAWGIQITMMCQDLEYVELYLHAPNNFMAWCLDTGTILSLPYSRIT
jgi:hypothetical protein